jgi:hypothetical protein
MAGVGRKIISRSLRLMGRGAGRATRPVGEFALLLRNTNRFQLRSRRKQRIENTQPVKKEQKKPSQETLRGWKRSDDYLAIRPAALEIFAL